MGLLSVQSRNELSYAEPVPFGGGLWLNLSSPGIVALNDGLFNR